MAILHVALLQVLPAGDDPIANLEIGLAACRNAAEGGADIAVLPELWQIGYTPCPAEGSEREAWIQAAIPTTDPWIETFQIAARELQMAIVVPFLERHETGLRNTAILIDRYGDINQTYAKVHTCDFGMEAVLTAGEGFSVTTLHTAAGPVEIGLMICFDRELPEPARILTLLGAEVILVPNACNITPDLVGQLQCRAFENMTAIATASYPAPKYNGHSNMFSGIAYIGRDVNNHLLAEAGEGEEILVVDLDLDVLREYRGREIWGGAYRKPHAYGPLLHASPAGTPFARADAKRAEPRASS